MRKLRNFILLYWFSLLLCLVSVRLAFTLIYVDHSIIGLILMTASVLKLTGMWAHNGKLRQIGVVVLTATWAVCAYVFVTGHVPVLLPQDFPIYIVLLGVGVALRGTFDE